jgi:ABC-type dipeptide/oligopeptide/nickel transport system ATPase subunit
MRCDNAISIIQVPFLTMPLNAELQNDLPTLNDKLEWRAEVARLNRRVMECSAPHVLGIHGEWGSGKTSFMRQVQSSLGGRMPSDASVDAALTPLSAAERAKMQKQVVTIWFDAWRYQNEATPIVALLHEMRRQMANLPSVIAKFKKLGTIATASLLDGLSDAAKLIGIEGMPNVEKIEKRAEKWEQEHYSSALNTNSIREHLQQTIECLLPDKENARVIIFIDDLDRCNPKAAMRLLEGLKIYMSIPRCVFVLGMNERILIDAIREEISAPKDTDTEELKLRASHYLEKICTDIYRLPLPSSAAALLMQWLHSTQQKEALGIAIGNIACLPPNPRRLKALANQWSRFASCVSFPPDHAAQKIWAVRVLVAAYIHQFHRDLWERWHFSPDFWIEIRRWCTGESAKTPPAWASSLKLTRIYTGGDETNASPAAISLYPNPGDIDNFWIGTLVQEYAAQLNPIDFRPLLTMPGAAL